MLSVLATCIILSAITQGGPQPGSPPPQATPKKDKSKFPDLASIIGPKTNWGKLTYFPETGKFFLTEHPKWDAVGHFRADGRVFILWTFKDDNAPCPGVYDLVFDNDVGMLSGYWGHGTEAYVDPCTGEICGSVQRDITRRSDTYD